MRDRKSPRRYYIAVISTAFVTAIGAVVFYSGIPKDNLVQFLTLGLLMVYAHTFSVSIGKKMSFSLSTATIFPIIFLHGTTPAMIMSAISGLLDGIMGKKSWDRILFNVSQLSLCSLVGSLVFRGIDGSIDPLEFRGVVAMGASALVYIGFNILIVTYLIALHSSTPWRNRLVTVGIFGFYSSVGTSFMGLIFTLFVVSYRFWGLLAFGALLIHFSELLKATAVVSDEREKRRELEAELVIDEMTQAYNFRYLNNWLNDPSEEKLGVLFIDIDDFKVFNDLYGHAEGDVVLRIITETIKKSIRANDQVIRYGGDEFVVLLPNQDGAGAKKVGRRIQGNLSKLPFASCKQPITVSIGVATMPEDTTDKRELLLLADQAMYAAKSSGKNTVRVYYSAQGPA